MVITELLMEGINSSQRTHEIMGSFLGLKIGDVLL